jgi:aminoglycoside 3-N-acetyltransferase
MSWRTPPSLVRFCGQVLPLLHRQADGRRALGVVADIVATDRWNSFDRFHDTTKTLLRHYEAAGARTEVYPVQTGGRLGSGRWIIHQAADVRTATVDVVSPVQQRLLDYRQNPWHAIQWSAATPDDGMRNELVIVDSPEELASLPIGRLTGKMVLTRLSPWDHWAAIAERGAAGMIADCPVSDLPEATAWLKFGWGGPPLAHAGASLVGLVLSEQEGRRLRALAAEHGRLTLHTRVDIRKYVGTHDVVSGIIHGRDDPQDEIWALAHSNEPGALDNASGVAVCIEVARVLEDLIAAGVLPRPRRSIRLLNAYECYGFFNYLETVRRLQPPLAGVVIDTVGSRPDVCNGRLHWHATLPMSAGFVDRVGEAILRAALELQNPGYRLSLEPFVETSDTLIGDPRCGFPAPWITTHFRDRGRASAVYHSSADTLEQVSPEGLAVCTAAMAAYLYYLAEAGSPDVMELARAETERTLAKLRAPAAERSPAEAEYLAGGCHRSLARLQRWLWGGDRAAILASLADHHEQIREAARQPAPAGPSRRPGMLAGAGRVPRRTAVLSPSGDNTPAPILERIRSAKLSSWALFWADGNRTLAEIAHALSCEYGREVSVEQVSVFFEAHADLGYVELIEPRDLIHRSRLIADLRALGLEKGMDVMVHSSLSRIGHVVGGAETVVDALLAVIGRRGTLLMPSFNHGAAHVFNPMTTPTTNGAIPDAMWRRPEAVRSLHPTHSVAAIGPKAAEYCRGHLEAGIWAQDSPIGRLIHGGGYLLSLGVTHESSTAYHVAENSVPSTCVDPFGKLARVVMPDGAVQPVRGLAWRTGVCPVPPSRIDETLDRHGLQRHGRVGRADATLVKARDLWEAHREHLKDVCPTCAIQPEAGD